MADRRSFAETVLQEKTGVVAPVAPEYDDTRDGYTKERQGPATANTLRLWFKDGRHSQGFPWIDYAGDEFTGGEGGETDRLLLRFRPDKIVSVEGYFLRRLLDVIDEWQLRSIQEHDAQEVALLCSEKVDLLLERQKPIICRIEVKLEKNEVRRNEDEN
jgi:hypothetical protein